MLKRFHLYVHINPSFGLNFQVICLLILVADLLVYALFLSPVAFNSLPFRIAPYIRVVFFILSIRYCGISCKNIFSKFKLSGISAEQNLECIVLKEFLEQ